MMSVISFRHSSDTVCYWDVPPIWRYSDSLHRTSLFAREALDHMAARTIRNKYMPAQSLALYISIHNTCSCMALMVLLTTQVTIMIVPEDQAPMLVFDPLEIFQVTHAAGIALVHDEGIQFFRLQSACPLGHWVLII